MLHRIFSDYAETQPVHCVVLSVEYERNHEVQRNPRVTLLQGRAWWTIQVGNRKERESESTTLCLLKATSAYAHQMLHFASAWGLLCCVVGACVSGK